MIEVFFFFYICLVFMKKKEKKLVKSGSRQKMFKIEIKVVKVTRNVSKLR